MEKAERPANQSANRRQSSKIKYALYGALVGCSLPVTAVWLNLVVPSLPVSGAASFQGRVYPLSWIIAVISILLGYLTGLVGERYGRLVQLNAEFSTTNTTLQAEVAEKQQAIAMLQQSETRYRSLVENANDGIMTFTLDGIVTSGNW